MSHDSVLAAWADAMRTPSNAPYSASARQSVVAKPCERRKRGVVVREPGAEQDQIFSASRPGDEESARALQIKKVVRRGTALKKRFSSAARRVTRREKTWSE